MKQAKEILILLWLAALIGLPVLGALNLHRVLADPAATWMDAALWGGIPLVAGVAAFVGRGLIFGLGTTAKARGGMSPSASNVRDDSSPLETRIEIHEANVDVVCVLRGSAASDAEGRRKIGEVASHFAGGAP